MRVENRVRSSNPAQCIFACLIAGVLFGLFMHPVAGILAFVFGLIGGMPAAIREAEEEADRLISNRLGDDVLHRLRRQGNRSVTLTTELKNIHPDMPIAGRIIFGDKLSKRTTYYLDDD